MYRDTQCGADGILFKSEEAIDEAEDAIDEAVAQRPDSPGFAGTCVLAALISASSGM